MNTTNTGNRAENLVAEELVRQGYEIIAQNWKTRAAEIDIVAQKSGCIYFVEVKFRRSDSAGDGFDYITPMKLRHMQRAAELWVQQNDWLYEYELLAAAVSGDGSIDIRQIA